MGREGTTAGDRVGRGFCGSARVGQRMQSGTVDDGTRCGRGGGRLWMGGGTGQDGVCHCKERGGTISSLVGKMASKRFSASSGRMSSSSARIPCVGLGTGLEARM